MHKNKFPFNKSIRLPEQIENKMRIICPSQHLFFAFSAHGNILLLQIPFYLGFVESLIQYIVIPLSQKYVLKIQQVDRLSFGLKIIACDMTAARTIRLMH